MAPRLLPSEHKLLSEHHAILSLLEKRQAPSTSVQHIDWRAAAQPKDLVLESWSQGLIVGALMIMGCITIANMRQGVLLHKLILAELLLALSHGTFCFMSFDGYGWYLSSTAMLLYISWIIHNIVAWLKVRPFFTQPGGFFKPVYSTWTKRIYIISLCLTVPAILFQISDNFRFFNNLGGWYKRVRPYEPLMRDPWWVFTCFILFHVVSRCYGTGIIELLRRSPRFGILLSAIFLSLIFTLCDIVASIRNFTGSTQGINPWWKLSLVFKCLTDTIMLDDFKTELKRLGIKRINKEEKRRNTIALVSDDGHLNMDDSDNENEEKTHGKPHWYGQAPITRTSTACEISPTTSLENSTMLNNPAKYSTKPLRGPRANMEELEFSTALFLDPSRLSGVDSVDANAASDNSCLSQSSQYDDQGNRPVRAKKSLNDHTKPLTKLPSLKQWSFEAIKPGKKSSNTRSLDDCDTAGVEAATPRSHGPRDDQNCDHRSTWHEFTATEAVKSKDSESGATGYVDGTKSDSKQQSEHRNRLNRSTWSGTNAGGARKMPNPDQGGVRAQLDQDRSSSSSDSESELSDASKERVRRFKQSICA